MTAISLIYINSQGRAVTLDFSGFQSTKELIKQLIKISLE